MEMLSKGLQIGKPAIIASGTGSGKTEAFLMPILAAISREALKWPKPEIGFLETRWWHNPENGKPYRDIKSKQAIHEDYMLPTKLLPNLRFPDRSPFQLHRKYESEKRPKAVRALIIYPMNALVEDQLVRLRRALDSAEAREVMDLEFGGNRIFFGKYTSKTPVTGFPNIHPGFQNLIKIDNKDPLLKSTPVYPYNDLKYSYKELRKKAVNRFRKSIQDLFQSTVEMELTQQEARKRQSEILNNKAYHLQQPASAHGSDDPFMFPAIDGSELTSRWDMQLTPPDILITNFSMLNTMLTREVEDPIFSSTRTWIESDDNSYFYLVLDELHLQRGSAGTEISFLVRLLIHRLGLDNPKHAHKLHILGSTASLPEQSIDSQTDKNVSYLSDFFGTHGTMTLDGKKQNSIWKDAIIRGEEIKPSLQSNQPGMLAPTPFLELYENFFSETIENDLFTADNNSKSIRAKLWENIGNHLRINFDGDFDSLIFNIARNLTERIYFACIENQRTRPIPLSKLVTRLFGELQENEDYIKLGRIILFIRGHISTSGFKPSKDSLLQSFRIHTFFRSIEGLYGPAIKGAKFANDKDYTIPVKRVFPIGQISIEREPTANFKLLDGTEKILRLFELLYCEACGELFYGGMRAKPSELGNNNIAELLPFESKLDGLPDDAPSPLFEHLNFNQYILFWPTNLIPDIPQKHPRPFRPAWRHGLFDPESGIVSRPSPFEQKPSKDNVLSGYYYDLEIDDLVRNESESHVPKACPKCGTDYSRRAPGQGRKSPVRNFRVGFARTTELLGSELLSAQAHTDSDQSQAKLVSFSDSRNDAARAALGLERRHHQDFYRDALLISLNQYLNNLGSESELEIKKKECLLNLSLAVQNSSHQQITELTEKLKNLHNNSEEVKSRIIPLNALIEKINVAPRDVVSPFIKMLVKFGIHPYDAQGIEEIEIRNTKFKWYELFEISDNENIRWVNHIKQRPGPEIDEAKIKLITNLLRNMPEVIFGKTYFNLEETGLGYASIYNCEHSIQKERREQLSSLMRVLADSYRYTPRIEQYGDPEDNAWDSPSQITTKRIIEFAKVIWGDDQWKDPLWSAVQELESYGHRGGIIELISIGIYLAQPKDIVYRCETCSRVHLHYGFGICTRCFSKLKTSQSETAEVLQQKNFLGKKVLRTLNTNNKNAGLFRMRCEELTGQTTDPADRQRRFRGIFINAEGETPPPQQVAEIDVLSVTTTMEVGIDIGYLNAVLQSNMPPQRFNYQQRVGRAGRRGQAFSIALTICRSKSHDLFYFRHPDRITGDPPPAPFLVKRLLNIPRRFLWKYWINLAFKELRETARESDLPFLGDIMSIIQPDIHGEFIPVTAYLNPSQKWEKELANALNSELVIQALKEFQNTMFSEMDEKPFISSSSLIKSIHERLYAATNLGLGHALADYGLFPMYGLPTRIRPLYIDVKINKNGNDFDTVQVDRDLEIAIFEFAPLSTVVRDKLEHKSIGLTPQFTFSKYTRYRENLDVIYLNNNAYSESFQLFQCSECKAWQRGEHPINCPACKSANFETEVKCVVPAAFITNFNPVKAQIEEGIGNRQKSLQAEGKEILLEPFFTQENGKKHSLRVYLDEVALTYRLNRGPAKQGFNVVDVTSTSVLSRRHQFILDHQKIIESSIESDWQRAETTENIWLAAPKTTDSIYIAADQFAPGLAFLPHKFGLRERWLGIRAGAISATFFIVNWIAEYLDIDPEELEVLEPRFYGVSPVRMVLQIADRLINGAGYCAYFAEKENGIPRILRLLENKLESENLIREFFHMNHRCSEACYQCLLRYGNQAYHGLLDWKLGLTYLQTMIDPNFECGLNGSDQGYPLLKDWTTNSSLYLAKFLAENYNAKILRNNESDIQVVSFSISNKEICILLSHPFWDCNETNSPNHESIFKQTYQRFKEKYPIVECWDTFNLSRRPLQVKEWLKSAHG